MRYVSSNCLPETLKTSKIPWKSKRSAVHHGRFHLENGDATATLVPEVVVARCGCTRLQDSSHRSSYSARQSKVAMLWQPIPRNGGGVACDPEIITGPQPKTLANMDPAKCCIAWYCKLRTVALNINWWSRIFCCFGGAEKKQASIPNMDPRIVH